MGAGMHSSENRCVLSWEPSSILHAHHLHLLTLPAHPCGKDGINQRVHLCSLGKHGRRKGQASLTALTDNAEVKKKEGEASRKTGHPKRERGENRTCKGSENSD